jgi:hypothetical protein
MLRRLALSVLTVAGLACAAAPVETPSSAPGATPAPPATPSAAGPARARLEAGGRLALPSGDGQLLLREIVWIDSPCPEGATCVWSGVKKEAHVTMERSGARQDAILLPGKAAELLGLRVRLLELEETAAELEVSTR